MTHAIAADADAGAPFRPVRPLADARAIELHQVAIFVRVTDYVLIVEVVDEHDRGAMDRAVVVEEWNVDFGR